MCAMNATTTNGFVRNNIFDSQYEYASKIIAGTAKDEHYLPFIYELDSPDEWDKEDCWIKANPGLGTVKSFDYLRQMVNKAKSDPSFKPTVMVKDFNLKENPLSRWLTYEEAFNDEKVPKYPFRYFIGGMDVADSVDLNAAKAIFQRPNDDKIYVKSMYWIPQSVIDEQDEKGNRDGRDRVPYKQWIEQGLMRTCPGNKVDKRVFLDWFCEIRDNDDIYPMYIGYDPWHISDELLRAFEQEFGKNVMIPVRQGVITLSEPMKTLKEDLQAKRIVYDNNPIDLWCLLNTDTKSDINGNIQPCKTDNRTQRIDGTVTFSYHKLRCAVSMTLEVETMALSAFESKFVNDVSFAMTKALEQSIVSGDGAGKPKGILSETPADGQALSIASGDTVSFATLIDMESALPAAYENGAVYFMTKKTFMQFYGMTDENGQPIARINYGIAGKADRVLLGRSVILLDEYMDSYSQTVASDTVIAFLFNPADYILNTNLNVTVKTYEDNDTEDKITKAVMIVDGKVVDKNSLVTLSIKAPSKA